MELIKKQLPGNLNDYCNFEAMQSLLHLQEVQQDINSGGGEINQFMELVEIYNKSQHKENQIDAQAVIHNFPHKKGQ